MKRSIRYQLVTNYKTMKKNHEKEKKTWETFLELTILVEISKDKVSKGTKWSQDFRKNTQYAL